MSLKANQVCRVSCFPRCINATNNGHSAVIGEAYESGADFENNDPLCSVLILAGHRPISGEFVVPADEYLQRH